MSRAHSSPVPSNTFLAGRAGEKSEAVPAGHATCKQEVELLQANVWKALGKYDEYAAIQAKFSNGGYSAAEARDNWRAIEAAMPELKNNINRNLEALKRCR